MNALWDKVTGGLSLADLCISGLRTIGSILEDEARDPKEAVRLVRHVWQRVSHVLSDPLQKSDVMTELGGLRAAMASTTAEVDAIIAAKPK